MSEPKRIKIYFEECCPDNVIGDNTIACIDGFEELPECEKEKCTKLCTTYIRSKENGNK